MAEGVLGGEFGFQSRFALRNCLEEVTKGSGVETQYRTDRNTEARGTSEQQTCQTVCPTLL